MSIDEQLHNFQFIVSVDGVGCADRLEDLFHKGACIIKQSSPLKEYWYNALVQQEHFLEATQLADIDDIVRRYYGTCNYLQGNAKRFAHEYLGSEHHLVHLANALNSYSATLRDNVYIQTPSKLLPCI
jgi:hypothetical protein